MSGLLQIKTPLNQNLCYFLWHYICTDSSILFSFMLFKNSFIVLLIVF